MCINDVLLRMVLCLCVTLNYVNRLDKKKKKDCVCLYNIYIILLYLKSYDEKKTIIF